MRQTININRLRLNVPDVKSSAEGRLLAKQVANGIARSFRGVEVAGLPHALGTVKVRVPAHSRPGDVADAVRSAIAQGTSGLGREKRKA